MKNFALLAAFALLPFAVPASAAEISKAAPATTLEQQTRGPVSPVEMMYPPPPLVQYCSAVQGTSCSPAGSTQACTDVCNNQLSCTCSYYYYYYPYSYTLLWNCDWEC
jgi:hypothetical protein